EAEDLLGGPSLPEADLSLGVGRDEEVAPRCEGEVVDPLTRLAEVKRFPAGQRVPEMNPLATGCCNEATVRGEAEGRLAGEDFSLQLSGLVERPACGGVPKLQKLTACRGKTPAIRRKSKHLGPR